MERIEFLLFRPDGQRMQIELKTLIVELCTSYSNFNKIQYSEETNILSFCSTDFELYFPEEGNRFSLSTHSSVILSLLNIITALYKAQNLLISTPGYEAYIDATSSEEEIARLLGI